MWEILPKRVSSVKVTPIMIKAIFRKKELSTPLMDMITLVIFYGPNVRFFDRCSLNGAVLLFPFLFCCCSLLLSCILENLVGVFLLFSS